MEVGRFELPIQRCKLCVLPVILYPLGLRSEVKIRESNDGRFRDRT